MARKITRTVKRIPAVSHIKMGNQYASGMIWVFSRKKSKRADAAMKIRRMGYIFLGPGKLSIYISHFMAWPGLIRPDPFREFCEKWYCLRIEKGL